MKEIRSKKSCRECAGAEKSSQVGRPNNTIRSEQGKKPTRDRHREWSLHAVADGHRFDALFFVPFRAWIFYAIHAARERRKENDIVNWFNLIDSRLVSDVLLFFVQRLFDFSHLFSQSFAIKYAYVGQMRSNETSISWAQTRILNIEISLFSIEHAMLLTHQTTKTKTGRFSII